jgi:hypothetical protein
MAALSIGISSSSAFTSYLDFDYTYDRAFVAFFYAFLIAFYDEFLDKFLSCLAAGFVSFLAGTGSAYAIDSVCSGSSSLAMSSARDLTKSSVNIELILIALVHY